MYISDTDLSNCPIYNPMIFQPFLQYKNTAETITKASVNHLGTCNPSSNSTGCPPTLDTPKPGQVPGLVENPIL